MGKWNKFSWRRHRRRLLTKLMCRDGTDCTICKEPLDRRLHDVDDPMYITLDHIVPRSHGGGDDYSNLRLAHKTCNEQRGNDPLEEEE
jgi:5-methylcytosine-specific restriction endonuclease McrA